MIADNIETKTFLPQDTAAWDEAYKKYEGIKLKIDN